MIYEESGPSLDTEYNEVHHAFPYQLSEII